MKHKVKYILKLAQKWFSWGLHLFLVAEEMLLRNPNDRTLQSICASFLRGTVPITEPESQNVLSETQIDYFSVWF